MNPVYSYTEDPGAFTITGDIEDCADFFYAFNADGVMAGSEDCGFLAGGDAEGGFVATDDFVAIGNEDAFIVMTEDSVMFGSTVTGANFTVEGITSDVNKDDELVMSDENGSSTFASDGSIVYTPTDPDADGFTLMDAVYTYTEEGDGGFVISGATKDCDDFTLTFNADGVVIGSEDCGFLAGGDAEGGFLATDDFVAIGDGEGGYVVTEDSVIFGNEDAFIVMTEDSVMFGSTVTGANFTVDGITSDMNEEDELVMSYEGGSTTFTADGSIVITPTDP